MKNNHSIEAFHRKFAKKVKAKNPELANKLSEVKYDWYRLSNSADDVDEYNLYIYDEILPAWLAEWIGGVSAEGLIAELEEVSASTINVRINSPGGAVFEAIAIYNALVTHSATINVYVDALAASAASIIAMAGDKITMMVGSQLMIHDAMGVEMGNAADMREFAKFLDGQSDNLASIYSARNGVEIKEMRALMLAETWMNAQEAVDLGLADEVYSKPVNPVDPPVEPKEDPPDEESTEESKEDEPVENLMTRQHSLANKGFKYAGRNRAPAPKTENIDEMIDVLANFLGGI